MLVYLDSALTDFFRLFLFFLFFGGTTWLWPFWGMFNVLISFWPLFWVLLFSAVFPPFFSIKFITKFTDDLLQFTTFPFEIWPTLVPFYVWFLLLKFPLLKIFFWKLFSICKLLFVKVCLLFSLLMDISTFFSRFSCSFSFLLLIRLPDFSVNWIMAPRLCEVEAFSALEGFLFRALRFFLFKSLFHCL